MKLICLNTWGGSVYGPLMDFIKTESATADIFCLQEVFKRVSPDAPVTAEAARLHLYEEVKNLLPDFAGSFLGTSQGHTLSGPVDYPTEMGQAIFVKKNLEIVGSNAYPIFGDYKDIIKPDFSNIPRGLLGVSIRSGGKSFNIFNYHGIPKPGDKLDTPDRLQQSEKIAQILRNITGPKILCGDFNLYPETKSVKILEEGMRNLIKDFKIDNTRNRLSWNRHGNTEQHFADFIFISPGVNAEKFEVPYNEISDHLPMILTFTIE